MTTDESSAPKPDENLLDEADRLIWALLDDQLAAADTTRLETLLKKNEQVRQRYLECVQIHADLHHHFEGDQPIITPDQPKSPVLGSLGDLRPDSGTLPPVTE